MNADRWKAEAPPGIGDTNERSQNKTARGGEMNKQSADEEREGSKLETRVTKLEEQTKWMYDRMAAAEASTWGKGVPWRQKDEGDDWHRWKGSWVDSGESRRFEFTTKEKDFKRTEEND